MIGVKRLEPFVNWLKANNYRGIVGEFSVPANADRDPRWLIILDNVYAYLRNNESRARTGRAEPFGRPDAAM